MFKKSILIGITIFILAGIILSYYYYPFTQTGCDNLRQKIEQQTPSANRCNLASDCSLSADMGCGFECGGYFSQKINQNWISRFNRRCRQCNENCYFEFTNPSCLNHTCVATGGAVYVKTNQEEYTKSEEIKLTVANNLLTAINYSFPISLCIRPTIMRLEKYNPDSKEWLSSGVGLLFDNNKIIFYQDPTGCPTYPIKNCKKEQAEKFIDKDSLKINESKSYTITKALIQPCSNDGQENPEPLKGRYRIGLYYEPPQGLGKQIYTNEFIVN